MHPYNAAGGRTKKEFNLNDALLRLSSVMIKPIDSASLGLFRIAFGYVLFLQGMKFQDLLSTLHHSTFVLPYPGLGWVGLLCNHRLLCE